MIFVTVDDRPVDDPQEIKRDCKNISEVQDERIVCWCEQTISNYVILNCFLI